MFKKIYVLRVKPGQELINEISAYCQQNNISSGIIIGIIGAVKNASMGIPFEAAHDKYERTQKNYNQLLSIVSGQGTIALMNGDLVLHIHVTLSGDAVSTGGHLFKATIWSTAEVTIGELDYQLRRRLNPQFGFSELQQQ